MRLDRDARIAPARIPQLQRTAVAAHGEDLRLRVVRHRRGMVVQAPVEVDEGLGELRIDARLRPYRPPPRQRGQRAQRRHHERPDSPSPRSEEHTSELQSILTNSYAVF